MNRNRWIAGFLFFILLFFTSCTRGDHKKVTTQNNQPSSDSISTQSGEIQTRAEPYPTVKIPTSPDDPYSQIIKDMYEQYAQYVTAEEIFEDLRYALYDIDENGINELLLNTRCIPWGSDDFTSNNPDAILVFDHFYSVLNNEAHEVKPVNGFWDYFAESLAGRDVLSNGIIRCCGGSPNYTSYAYYIYKDGVLTFLKALRYYADETRWLITFEGDQSTRTPITEEEFNRTRAEIEGDAQVVEIDWKPLERYGLE